MTFTIDATSNSEYYIVLKDGVEFVKVPKRDTKLEDLKAHCGIKEVE